MSFLKLNKHYTIILFILWCVLGFGFVCFQYLFWGPDYLYMNLPALVCVLAELIFFLPLMLIIHRQAKCEKINWLTALSKILLIFIGSAVAVMGIYMLIHLINEVVYRV